MAKKKMDEKFMEGFIKHLREEQHIGFDLDEFDADDVATVTDIVVGLFQHIGKTLSREKSETEVAELSLPGYLDLKVSYRENADDNDDGNWGIGLVAGEELKKYIKLPANDDEDEDGNEEE